MPPAIRKTEPRRWYQITAKAEGQAEILIYEEIVDPITAELFGIGQSAKSFARDLKALGPVTQLDVRINSVGGDVFEGTAIYNLLKTHRAKKTVYVDGIAASIASVIAMAGDTIVIADNAWMMVHDPSGLVWGTAEDMRKMAEAMDKIKAGLVTAYQGKTGRPADEIQALMSDETWMTAEDAVSEGFADQVGPAAAVEPATDSLQHRFRKMPRALQGLQALRPAATATSAPPAVPSPANKETTMDLETLRKDHPAIAAALIEEGRRAGESQERERVAKIHAAFTKVWGATPTVAELAIRDEIVALELTPEESEKTFKARKLTLIATAAPQSAGGGADPQPDPALAQLQGEELWQAEWDRNAGKVRDEFTSVETYKAYKKADARGAIKRLTKSAA